MTVPLFHPKISVVLKKNIGRATVAGTTAASERYSGSIRTIDLTPFLGERSSVVTSKSIREPCGMFSITLADRMADTASIKQFDSIYGLIEPMDVVEIRMAHDTSKYSGFPNHMPIIMRGFVTDIRRNQNMNNNGPDRSVVISGQDYGKIFQIMQIAYLPNEVTGQNLLTYFKFFENYGIGSDPNKPASDFMSDIVKNVVTPFLSQMRQAAGASSGQSSAQSPVLDMKLDATVATGVVAPFGTIQSFQGNLWSLLQHYGDVGPWNELFVEDREAAAGGGADAPYLVYRPTPFKDASGALIQASNGAVAPASVTVTDKELFGLSSGRSDSSVANYYWVDPLICNLNTPGFLQLRAAQEQQATLFLTDYPNSDPKLYGFRRMEVATQQGQRYDAQDEAEYNKRQATNTDFATQRREVLLNNNRDNVVFETGAMRLRGNEAIKAGMTVKLIRGDQAVGSEHYAVAVRHEFLPFRSFTTSIDYERGTGFIDRIKKGSAGAPYLSEMSAGGVYAPR